MITTPKKVHIPGKTRKHHKDPHVQDHWFDYTLVYSWHFRILNHLCTDLCNKRITAEVFKEIIKDLDETWINAVA